MVRFGTFSQKSEVRNLVKACETLLRVMSGRELIHHLPHKYFDLVNTGIRDAVLFFF